MSRDHLTRRRMVQLTGAVAASAALAGCGSNDTGGTATPANDDNDGGGDSGGGDTPSFDGWFDQTDNYDGVVDETGSSSVTVSVGAGSDGLLFDPPAIRVDAGTAVTWEWTDKGGSHNVVAEDGSFESELVGEEGHTFEHTFEAAGEFRYACEPHRTMGMKGVVVVE